MKMFLAKALLVLLSITSVYITDYYLIQFTCASKSPIYTKQYGPPSDLVQCKYEAKIPAAITAVLVGLLVLYVFLKIIFKYSFKSYLIFLLKLILFLAVVLVFVFLLYLPVNNFLCRFTTPKLEFSSDGRVVPGTWGICNSIGFGIQVLTVASIISTILSTAGYFILTKWKRRKKNS